MQLTFWDYIPNKYTARTWYCWSCQGRMKLAAWGGFVSVVCGILAMVPVLPLLRHIPGYLGVFVVSPVMIGVIGGVGMLLGKLVPVEGTFFEPPASAATLAGRPTEIADEK